MDNIYQILYIVIIILLSLTVHEVAHGYVSYRLGDPTAKNMGRLTLNPIKHLDVLGTIVMVASMYAGAGFGWAKPVPINPAYYRHTKRDTMLVSVAGPLSNLLLAFISVFPLVYLGYKFDLNSLGASDIRIVLFNFLLMLFVTNTNLAIFNLIPVPPLDGSKILAGLLPTRQYYKYLEHERYISFAFMILIFVGFYMFPNILNAVTNPVRLIFIDIARPIIGLIT